MLGNLSSVESKGLGLIRHQSESGRVAGMEELLWILRFSAQGETPVVRAVAPTPASPAMAGPVFTSC